MTLYDASSGNRRNFIQRKYYITQFRCKPLCYHSTKIVSSREQISFDSKFYFIETFSISYLAYICNPL